MANFTEVNTFDLEPGLVVRVSENVYASVEHIFPNWIIPNEYVVNFSNMRYDGSYEDTKIWEVIP